MGSRFGLRARSSLAWLLAAPCPSAKDTDASTFFSAVPLAFCAAGDNLGGGAYPLQTIDILALAGLVFLFRSFGFALNEVVVAHAKDPGGLAVLRRFTFELAALLVGALLVVALSPLGSLWFGTASGFAEPLAALSASALLLAVLMPGYQTLQSYYQGVLVATGRTRPVTEAVALYLVVSCVGLGIAATWDFVTGLYAALGVFTIAGLSQTLWVRWRALPALRELSR